ncbi:unnamed protein product [Cylicostephanus goldi]|uniref:FAD-dependent oxidoreductase domain-containing protein 1 n=1 Tax=Cylicostephanus goldi TaxID=71465 RepID=A0A3P6RA33_CYLGO|nr:unnamed protein product [Cylicostephanus goldi]
MSKARSKVFNLSGFVQGLRFMPWKIMKLPMRKSFVHSGSLVFSLGPRRLPANPTIRLTFKKAIVAMILTFVFEVRPQMSDTSARPIRAHLIVNAAGPWAGKIAELAGIGKGKGLLAVPVPIRPKRRTNFVVHAPDVPVDIPAIVEPCGVFCRQLDVGNTFVVGRNPPKPFQEEDTDERESLEVDYNEFYEKIWPVLVQRTPAFQTAKIKSAWCGLQDVNTFDSAPVIGEHPLYQNLFMMCGFGGRLV